MANAIHVGGRRDERERRISVPIWITISGTCPKVMMWTLNEKLQEFFTKEAEDIADTGHVVNVEWTINKHVVLKQEGEE